jgi:hypothetical protein
LIESNSSLQTDNITALLIESNSSLQTDSNIFAAFDRIPRPKLDCYLLGVEKQIKITFFGFQREKRKLDKQTNKHDKTIFYWSNIGNVLFKQTNKKKSAVLKTSVEIKIRVLV